MSSIPREDLRDAFHDQELRIALVMNGGVSLAVWIGGVTNEINRLVQRDTVYGRLCESLQLLPRVDIISGTSAGGINGALLALAMTQKKSLEPLRDIWLDKGDIFTLLRKPTESNPPSLLNGDNFYKAMLESFQKICEQQGKLRPPDQVPIELTLTTTLLQGEVNDFPDDVGSVIRDVTHRGLITFRRGPDIIGDPFASESIAKKLATAARATASFPGAFEPLYLPPRDKMATADKDACLEGYTNFELGRYVVDGGVLDNNPLESAIDAVFSQRAEGEVRRVLAYVVPDPGHISDLPSRDSEKIPTFLSTTLASLVNIPRVESVSAQLEAIAKHNLKVSQLRDTRVLVARSLNWTGAEQLARSAFPGYRFRRIQSAADYVAIAMVEGAARHRDATGQGVALGRRARQRIAAALTQMPENPWVPQHFDDSTDQTEWQWGLFTLQNIMSTLLDLLRRGVGLVPARRREFKDETWQALKNARYKAYNLLAELTRLRSLDKGHWVTRGKELAPALADLGRVKEEQLKALLQSEIHKWVRVFDKEIKDNDPLRPPSAFKELALNIGELYMESIPLLREVLSLGVPTRGTERFAELKTLVDFLDQAAPSPESFRLSDALVRLLTLEVIHYAFGAETTSDQYMELVQFSANVPTAFGGPSRLEEKLAGVQVGHFGAFYKRSWRINDWMFGRLDGAERIVRILLDPARLARLYGREPGGPEPPENSKNVFLDFLREAVFDGLSHEDDINLLQMQWKDRLNAMTRELSFLDTAREELPESLPECGAMVLERLHLDILRHELPTLAYAVGDDELDGADTGGNGSKFLKRFRGALIPGPEKPPLKLSKSTRKSAHSPALSAKQLIELFKGAKVGEERILTEAGTDRFTRLATQSAAIAVSTLSGKSSGLIGWLRGVFATLRTPLVALDILARALMKKGRIFVSLYAMAMAVSATVLLSGAFVSAKWPGAVTNIAGFILVAGLVILLRRNPKLLVGFLLLILLIIGGPFIRDLLDNLGVHASSSTMSQSESKKNSK